LGRFLSNQVACKWAQKEASLRPYFFGEKFETHRTSFGEYRLDRSDSLVFNDQRNLADWADITDQKLFVPPT